ncbi:MAG: PP2C family protein-serine/threonine phosphatase [Candidatus Altiarchaeota archaeon]
MAVKETEESELIRERQEYGLPHPRAIDNNSASRQLELLNRGNAILGQFFPTTNLPKIDGITYSALSKPLEYMSGDVHGVVKLDDGKFGLYVGDVTEHGPGAALAGTYLRGMFDSLQARGLWRNPGEMMRQADSILAENLPEDQSATLFYGVYDSLTRKLTYVNAGHTRPILYHAETGEVEVCGAGGLPLGYMKGVNREFNKGYETGNVTLKENDILLVYTDGLSEGLGVKKSGKDVELLGDLIGKNKNLTPSQLTETLAGMAKDVRDDVTIMVFKVDPGKLSHS